MRTMRENSDPMELESPYDDQEWWHQLDEDQKVAALEALSLTRAADRAPGVVDYSEDGFLDGRGLQDGGKRCQSPTTTGRPCPWAAGYRTWHPGVGHCQTHGGNKHRRRREEAWTVAHAYARQLEVSPWDALLLVVRLAAGKLAFCEAVLGQAESDEQLVDDRYMVFWQEKSELWSERLARYSKAAIDAGVAERMIVQVELQGKLMHEAAVLTMEEGGSELERRALSALGQVGAGQVAQLWDEDFGRYMIATLARHVVRLEGQQRTLDGVVVNDGDAETNGAG